MKSSNDHTMPLFPEEAIHRRMTARIAPRGPDLLSKEQKAFNSLLKKIETSRNLIADWKIAIPLFKQRYTTDLLPLRERETGCLIEAARALDDAYGRKGITKTEKNKLAAIILNFTRKILDAKDDEECKVLYAKYSQSDFDEEQAAQQAAELEGMKAMLEGALGIDLEGLDIEDAPEKVFARIAKQMEAREEERQARQAKRKKTAKQLEREAKQAEEEKQISQSIREVYRKLARALHPDRETDPEEKQRKTELMQQANEAYAKGNLLELLELQLRLEHIDQAHLATLDPQKLKRYIQILKDQLDELEMEIHFVREAFASEFSLSLYDLPPPQHLTSLIDRDIRVCERSLERLAAVVADARDPQHLKAWLKTVRFERRSAWA